MNHRVSTLHPYATDAYARSLSHWGRALPVPEWGSSVITRPLPNGLEDAAGTYPLAVLATDADVEGGLEGLRRKGLVSVTLVVDEFLRPPLDRLVSAFDIVTPFKVHFLNQPQEGGIRYSKKHRYEVRRALRSVRTGLIDLGRDCGAWQLLYQTLIHRHGLSGLHAFPEGHHKALASLDGVTAIGAWVDDELVSGHVWVWHGGYVHSHLGASSERGYAVRAAYAVYDAAIRHFADAEVINLGGGAGSGNNLDGGLARFKRGFANATANAYLCGKVLLPHFYRELVANSENASDVDFFPAYRAAGNPLVHTSDEISP